MTDRSYTLFDTAIGRCGVAWRARGIVAVQLPQQNDSQTLKRIMQRCGEIAEASPPVDVQQAIDAIVDLLKGEKRNLADVALDLDGVPDFNRSVYDIARTIPPGKTMTYGDIAKRLGGVELSRDVGQALGRNPCPIVVAVPSCPRSRRETRRLFGQWRRGDETQTAGNRRRGCELHAVVFRLTYAAGGTEIFTDSRCIMRSLNALRFG